jgi:Skp family chaperone for outer membrane proteins
MINLTIKEFAISENYDLILYQNAAFASDQVNITNKIISKIKGISP